MATTYDNLKPLDGDPEKARGVSPGRFSFQIQQLQLPRINRRR